VNEQKAEKLCTGLYLDVHSIFHTIQGEGPYAGYPAVFVRLAGCNLQCPGCDTDYTSGRTGMSNGKLARALDTYRSAYHQPIVVITGGEPFRQPVALARTVALLLNDGWKVQIESNGTLPPGDLDIRAEVVVSPKAPVVHKGLFPYVKALKYVLSARNVDPADGLPTSALGLVHKARLWRPPEGLKVPIYIQPEDNNEYQDNVQAVINSAMKYGYIMNLQMHKLVGLE